MMAGGSLAERRDVHQRGAGQRLRTGAQGGARVGQMERAAGTSKGTTRLWEAKRASGS
jgi:hypothetical protein